MEISELRTRAEMMKLIAGEISAAAMMDDIGERYQLQAAMMARTIIHAVSDFNDMTADSLPIRTD